MKKTVVAAVVSMSIMFAANVFAADAAFTVTVWRGEKTYADVPAECADSLAQIKTLSVGGVKITPLVLDEVAYQISHDSPEKAKRADVCRDWKKGESRSPSMCRIETAQSTKPQTYSFGPLQVRVINRVLPPPAEWKYFLDLWQHPWAVARFFGVEPFSKEHYAAMKPVYRALADCGCKALTVTLLDRPWNGQCFDPYHSMIGRVKNADGTWTFDYKLFDEYVKFGRECGLGPDIACYTMCPWGYFVDWTDHNGKNVRLKALPGTEEFNEYWGSFLVDFAKHLKEKGWFNDAYIAMDERKPDDVRKIVAFIHEKAPGLKVSMCGNRDPSQFEGIDIENFCLGLNHLKGKMAKPFLENIANRRAKGQKTTFYVCCSPAHPNTFMESPADEGYWVGAYPIVLGFDGFLRWAANSWPKDPYSDATFKPKVWKAGDTYLVYPRGELSARMIALRNGIVAGEKLRILRETGAKPDVSHLLSKYGYRGACNNAFDFGDFRREMEEIVNKEP